MRTSWEPVISHNQANTQNLGLSGTRASSTQWQAMRVRPSTYSALRGRGILTLTRRGKRHPASPLQPAET